MNVAASFDIDWSADFVDSTVASGVVRKSLLFEVELKGRQDVIDSIGVSIVYVPLKHFFDFFNVELSGAAKSEVKAVVKPGVISQFLVIDPLFELIEACLLGN